MLSRQSGHGKLKLTLPFTGVVIRPRSGRGKLKLTLRLQVWFLAAKRPDFFGGGFEEVLNIFIGFMQLKLEFPEEKVTIFKK